MAALSYLSCPHFPGNRQRRFPGKWGRVEDGSLVAATCIVFRDGRFNNQKWYLPTIKLDLLGERTAFEIRVVSARV